MALTFQNAGAMKSPYTHWFFYGDTGAGKTFAAGTFPRPLMLVPTQERSHITLMGREDVDFVLIANTVDMEEALNGIEARYAEAKRYWRKAEAAEAGSAEQEELYAKGDERFPWQTIVIESVTHYCDLMQEEITQGGKKDMGWGGWGQVGSHLRNLQNRLRELPTYVVFTALEERSYHPETRKLISGGPMFPGKMRYKLPSACDAIVHFERKSGKPNDIFRAHFRKQGVFAARVRMPGLSSTAYLQPFDFSEVDRRLREHAAK